MREKNLIKLAEDYYWSEYDEIVLHHNEPVQISSNQSKLLQLLIDAKGNPLTSIDIFANIWRDYDKEYSQRSIRNLVFNLRKKLPFLNIVNYHGGLYALKLFREKTPDITEHLFDILDQAKNGIVITDPAQDDNPIIYANNHFTQIFGYRLEEVLGKNCRFLQGEDKDQSEIEQMRNAIRDKKAITVTLKNYHKSGKLIYNEITVSPIFDKSNKIKYFLGVQKDLSNS